MLDEGFDEGVSERRLRHPEAFSLVKAEQESQRLGRGVVGEALLEGWEVAEELMVLGVAELARRWLVVLGHDGSARIIDGGLVERLRQRHMCQGGGRCQLRSERLQKSRELGLGARIH